MVIKPGFLNTNMQLLQIQTQLDTAAVDTTANEAVTVGELLLKGGYVMLPLIILSILAIYIFVERVLTIKKASKVPAQFTDKIKNLVASGDINGARLICSQTDSPIARMIEKGISRIGSPLKTIEASIENVGKIELYRLEKNLNLMATISGAAPMIGFLGTVTGMIQAFIAIAQEEGNVSPRLLSTGIYEAMITTATGLAVGIIAYLGYNYLVSQVSKVVHKMEYSSIEFIDLLQEPR
jgi:biopolymer transport protein ExbB